MTMHKRCRKEIEQIKEKLKKKKVCENFGQEEIRKLYDKYTNYEFWSETQLCHKAIREFERWCMDYCG